MPAPHYPPAERGHRHRQGSTGHCGRAEAGALGGAGTQPAAADGAASAVWGRPCHRLPGASCWAVCGGRRWRRAAAAGLLGAAAAQRCGCSTHSTAAGAAPAAHVCCAASRCRCCPAAGTAVCASTAATHVWWPSPACGCCPSPAGCARSCTLCTAASGASSGTTSGTCVDRRSSRCVLAPCGPEGQAAGRQGAAVCPCQPHRQHCGQLTCGHAQARDQHQCCQPCRGRRPGSCHSSAGDGTSRCSPSN